MKDLYSFLNEISENSDFKASLSERGGFITFSNSGRRGGAKFFQIGLDNILQTLKDILLHIAIFRSMTEYDETSWRNQGGLYFSDPVANANSTVQTKPLFSTLSKVIIWANQPMFNNFDSDKTICLDQKALETTIAKLEIIADAFTLRSRTPNTMYNEIAPQIIFYGAPGTGKSNKIKSTLNNVTAENKFRTTFHPDSDYASFVGAYKPTMTKPMNQIYGIDELTSILAEMKNSGVTYAVHKFGSLYWLSLKELSTSERKTILNSCGIPESMDIEMGKGIAIGEAYLNGLNESRIIYSFVPQVFLHAYVQAYLRPEEKVYLIIEEINRGNCAQIFGDLFQLLDRDHEGASEYSIKADEDIRNYLEAKLGHNHIGIKNGTLRLPSNLYIWATMNTSDQSLFPIDSAFKRRWNWEYMPIEYDKKDWRFAIGDKQYSWGEFLKLINPKIAAITTSEDKQMGYFFAKPDQKSDKDNPALLENDLISEKVFVNKVLFYLWTDVFKDYDLTEEPFVYEEDNVRKAFRFTDFFPVENNPMLAKFIDGLGLQNLASKETEQESDIAIPATDEAAD